MAKKLKHLPASFPIKLQRHKHFIIDPGFGHHDQFTVTANGFEIGRFMDPVSCDEFIKFITGTHFKHFLDSPEGQKVYETVFLMGERERLKPEIGKDGGLIVRDALDKNRLD